MAPFLRIAAVEVVVVVVSQSQGAASDILAELAALPLSLWV